MPERQLTLSESPRVPTNTGPAPAKAADLTVNKIIAGAGAAATVAAFGSFFGAAGTVAGAALGSMVSTVGATVYQRSLDRTRDTVRARVRIPGGRAVEVPDGVEVPAPRISPGEPGQARVHVIPAERPMPRPMPRPRRRVVLVAGATLLVFVLGLLAVTGVEWIKGSTLTAGQPGTSVGRVLDGGGAPPPAVDPETEPSETTEPTSSSAGSRTPAPSGSSGTSAEPPSTEESRAPVDDTERRSEPVRPTGLPLVPGIG